MEAQGQIGAAGLTHWWNHDLTAAQRERMETLFQPLGLSEGSRPLTTGNFSRPDGGIASALSLLSSLVGWLTASVEDVEIRRAIRKRMDEALSAESDLVTRHFGLQVMSAEFYRDRESDPSALSMTVRLLEQQIAMAPDVALAMHNMFPTQLPRHAGFQQLAIILEKSRDYGGAIALCHRARDAGWDGDWEKRIKRCNEKLARHAARVRERSGT